MDRDQTESVSGIYGPRNFKNEFVTGIRNDEIRPVLAKIEEIYGRVKLDTNKDESLLRNGFCFGLLDPASNVVVNSVIMSNAAVVEGGGGGGEQPAGGDGDMTQRSFDGLVASLTTLFPYLPRREATAYLDAAGADPLVAALLVIDRRGMRRFGFCSGTTVAAVETALRCAAAAARHPHPQRLVQGWKLLAPHLKNLVSELSTSHARPDAIVGGMLSTTHDTGSSPIPSLELQQSWELASSRRRANTRVPKALPSVRGAMKRIMLSTIHGFYLQALAMLPTDDLRTRYHHGMLMGGYCYGPLDPVSNIIVNTVWHEHNFPLKTSSRQVTLHVISTPCLWRIAARSLYGLLSFMCTRYPGLTPDQALQRLLAAGADLRAADPNLFDPNNNKPSWFGCLPVGWCSSRPSASVAVAYAAAATAAFHPDPVAHKEFLGSPDSVSRLKAASGMVPQDGRQLSSELLVLLSEILLQCPSSTQQEQVPREKVTRRIRWYHSQCDATFWELHERVYSKAKVALDAFNKDRVPKFRLHVICGVNELVSGPEFCTDRNVKRPYNPGVPYIYHHCHINFLAYESSESAKDGAPLPVLFFAECSNHGIHTESWCVPVVPPHPGTEQARCIYCESEGRSRIVHPSTETFHGRGIEFEKVLRGEPLFRGSNIEGYSNDNINEKQSIRIDWVHSRADDSIYSIDDDVATDDEDEWNVDDEFVIS